MKAFENFPIWEKKRNAATPEYISTSEQPGEACDAMNAMSPGKRQRTEETQSVFKLTFEATQTFSDMIAIVSHVLPEWIKMTIESNESFSGLVVKSMDENKLCLVHARVSGNVEFGEGRPPNGDPVECKVKTQDLKTCLKTMLAQGMEQVVIYQNTDECSIHMTSLQAKDGVSDVASFALALSESTETTVEPHRFVYESSVVIGVKTMLQLVQSCLSFKARDTTFEVHHVAKEDSGKGAPPSFFTIKGDGDRARMSMRFVSPDMVADDTSDGRVSEASVAPCQESALDKECKYDLQCRQLFPTDYLNMFLKSMDKNGSVNIRLGADKPMRMSYPIDNGQSVVTFLLAPRVNVDA